jgi:DNA topoisomerase I
MSQPLVIVESPAKARTIAGYLGDEYVVESSIGHIRDLPANAADVPAAYKGESWARLGVDTDNDFKPLYVVNPDKRKHVSRLKALLKDASELYLATDEDREGEAIAWHLLEVLNPRVPVRRMVFHEITPQAIQAAIDNPREVDRRLVDAQEARRILDRLYGYEVSPVLWKKVMPRLSAGRVQSVATRIVVERERERMDFRSASYWDLDGRFAPAAAPADEATPASFGAGLASVDGQKVATGKDFDADGVPDPKVVVLDEAQAVGLAEALVDRPFAVRNVDTRPYRRRPAAPFITSTLQQEGGRKLRMSAAQVMRAAQSLYEAGLITYMRTDSTTLSETALRVARAEISQRFGAPFLPDAPRSYAKKVKNAQEAHEAIRPAGDRWPEPRQVANQVGGAQARVYELIWQRTLASQMTDALGETVSVRLGATTAEGRDAEFAASGTVITHPGFRRVYVESSDEPDTGDDAVLPPVAVGDELSAVELTPQGHETQPPSRYTEASLVKRLEELGVGRPSTYASIISTIQDRGYVWKKGSALVPSFTAFAVVTLLERHFPDLVDYAFTARMEDDLDAIAGGDRQAIPWLNRFYFGEHAEGLSGNGGSAGDGGSAGELDGLKAMVSERLGDIDARSVNSIRLGDDPDGTEIVARTGRYGPYVQRGEDTASIPEDLPPDELTVERALELLSQPKGDRVLGTDPETGLPVIAKAGRFGPYVQLGEMVDGAKEKPPTSSLFKTMTVEDVTLDEALRLLSLPRVVGVDPADGEEVLVQNGRYGPYLKKGGDTRSLESEEQLFDITLEECLRLLAEPKRRGRGVAKPPLREMGDDPNTGRSMVVKDGRFGPYVTDGETNASLRRGDSVEDLTVDRAAELLQDRRDRGPVKKKAKKKATKKKAPAKKKAAKKKAPAKKKAAKKKAAKKKAPAKKKAAEKASAATESGEQTEASPAAD